MLPRAPSLVSALALLSCASAAPQAGRPPAAAPAEARPGATAGEEIALRFAWPDGLRGTRDERHASAGALLGATRTATVRLEGARRDGAHVLTVRPHPPREDGVPFALALVASADGVLQRIDGTSELRRSLDEALGRDLPAGELRERYLDDFTRMLSSAEEEAWREGVQRWAGKVVVLGETYRGTWTRPSAEEPPPLPEQLAWGARRRVPCAAGEAARCVELWAEGETDAAALARACAPDPGAHLLRLLDRPRRVRWTLEVIADPGTLVPYRLARKVTREAGCEPRALEGGSEEWALTYRWER